MGFSNYDRVGGSFSFFSIVDISFSLITHNLASPMDLYN